MTCGQPTDDGDPCDRPAGWGTDDDSGPCADHRGDKRARTLADKSDTDSEPWGDVQRRRILDALRDGATLSDAAAAAGVSARQLRRWRNGCEAVDQAVERAEAEAATEAVRLVREAAENGDWRAGSWFLENRHGYGDDPDPEQFVEVVRDTIREELDGPTARKLMAAIGDRLEELDR